MSRKINVCGKLYIINEEILQGSELFCNFMEDFPESEEIPIQRSPKLFEHVLAYLIDPNYFYPCKYARELDYYLIDRPKHLPQKKKKTQEDVTNILNMSKPATPQITSLNDLCSGTYCISGSKISHVSDSGNMIFLGDNFTNMSDGYYKIPPRSERRFIQDWNTYRINNHKESTIISRVNDHMGFGGYQV